MTPSRWLLLGAVAFTFLAWASAFVVIRGVGPYLDGGPLALGRLAVGVVALGIATLIAHRWVWPTRREWIQLAVYGVAWFGAYNVALNTAEQTLDAGTAAMIVGIGPILIALGAGLFLGEGIPKWLAIGAAVAFVGVVLIGIGTTLAQGSAHPVDVLGAVLALVAAVTYAIGVITQKPVVRRIPAIQATFLGCAIGLVVCLPFSGLLVTQLAVAPPAAWWGAVYLGRGSDGSRVHDVGIRPEADASRPTRHRELPVAAARDPHGFPRVPGDPARSRPRRRCGLPHRSRSVAAPPAGRRARVAVGAPRATSLGTTPKNEAPLSRHPQATVGRRHRLMAAIAAVALGLFSVLVPAASASAAVDATGQVVDSLGQPAAGVPLEINRAGTDYDNTLVTDASGFFTIPALEDDGYEVFFQEGTTGTGGERFSVGQRFFTVSGGVVAGLAAPIVVDRYVAVSGTITNWSPTMGSVRVDIFSDRYGVWQSVNINPNWVDSTNGSFTIYAPIRAANYTLRFMVSNEDSPYADAYLGGGYNQDPALATHLPGSAGVGFLGLTMVMPDAAVISGRVTDSYGPLAGVLVWAEDDPDYNEYAEDTTDSNGEYTLYVRPGLTYIVGTYGDPTHSGLVYDGFECDCSGFTPVLTTVPTPAVNIDLELTEETLIEGVVFDDDVFDIVAGLDVKLYKLSVGGVWVLHDEIESIYDWPAFEFQITSDGQYRIQFVDADGDVLMVVDGATEDFYGDGQLLDPVPACYAELNQRSEYAFVYAVVDLDTVTAACAALVAVIPAPTPGSGVVKKPRATSLGGAAGATPTPTPTPSATPTASPSPSESANPAPTSTPAATEEPLASAPDFWWLLWVLLGVVVIAVVGGVVYFVRRA